MELQFDKPLSEAITCLLYLEYGNCAYRSTARCIRRLNNGHGADTLHAKVRAFISRRLSVRHSASFDNTLRDSYRKYRSTHGKRNALASHTSTTTILLLLFFRFLRLTASHPIYPDFPVPRVLVWEYNTIQLQGWTSTVCGEYCCLFDSTWTVGTRRVSLWASSMPPPLTGTSAYSYQSLDCCVRHVAGVRAALHL